MEHVRPLWWRSAAAVTGQRAAKPSTALGHTLTPFLTLSHSDPGRRRGSAADCDATGDSRLFRLLLGCGQDSAGGGQRGQSLWEGVKKGVGICPFSSGAETCVMLHLVSPCDRSHPRLLLRRITIRRGSWHHTLGPSRYDPNPAVRCCKFTRRPSSNARGHVRAPFAPRLRGHTACFGGYRCAALRFLLAGREPS